LDQIVSHLLSIIPLDGFFFVWLQPKGQAFFDSSTETRRKKRRDKETSSLEPNPDHQPTFPLHFPFLIPRKFTVTTQNMNKKDPADK
jgi:hypothetical protein